MDARSDVLDRIAATNPLPDGARYDSATADRLYVAIVAESRLPTSRRVSRRWLIAATVVIAVAAIAAPALAFSDGVRSFLGLQSEPAVLEEARLLVSAPVAEGTVARLWVSPSKIGGECSFVTFGPPGTVERPSEMGGGLCSDRPLAALDRSRGVTVTVSKRPLSEAGARAWVPPVIEGYVDPSLGASRVEIRWTGGSKELAYANGYFIGAVEALYQAPAGLLPIRIIAYDADGREVDRRDVNAEWFRIN
jgi:hypothetical protein